MRKLKDNSTGSFDFAQDDSFDFHWTYSAKSSRFGDWYGNKVDVVRPIVSSRRAADFFSRIKAAKRESRDARDEGRGNDLHITFARFRARRIKQQRGDYVESRNREIKNRVAIGNHRALHPGWHIARGDVIRRIAQDQLDFGETLARATGRDQTTQSVRRTRRRRDQFLFSYGQDSDSLCQQHATMAAMGSEMFSTAQRRSFSRADQR